MLTGIDFSFGSGITAAQIKAAGYHFVARYLSGGNNKDVSAAEIANYKAAGIPVVFVFEIGGNEYNVNQGVADATTAVAELAKMGVTGATVFFAQDVPLASGVHPIAYMQGVNSVIGVDRSGIYGEYAVVKEVLNAGVAKYAWQTSGGSGGLWDARALLRQVNYDVKVGPATVDVDQAAYWTSATILDGKDDFGQWPRPATVTPEGLTYAAPTGLKVTAGHTSFKATWSAPAHPGLPVPVGYWVYAYEDADLRKEVTGYPRHYVQSGYQGGGLKRHTKYLIRVVTVGANGANVRPATFAQATFTTG